VVEDVLGDVLLFPPHPADTIAINRATGPRKIAEPRFIARTLPVDKK
jgi:hypothetical protein